jgi:hypothetical protein
MGDYVALVSVLIWAGAIILFMFRCAIPHRGIYINGKIIQRIKINNTLFILVVDKKGEEYPIVLKTTKSEKYTFRCGDTIGISVYKTFYFYRCDLSSIGKVAHNLIVYE